MQITTVGFDIAKNVLQVHGIDAAEKVVVRKPLRRGQVMAFFEGLAPCLVGMEACPTTHHWARKLTKLGIVAAQGREGIKQLLTIVAGERDPRLPVDAHASLIVRSNREMRDAGGRRTVWFVVQLRGLPGSASPRWPWNSVCLSGEVAFTEGGQATIYRGAPRIAAHQYIRA